MNVPIRTPDLELTDPRAASVGLVRIYQQSVRGDTKPQTRLSPF